MKRFTKIIMAVGIMSFTLILQAQTPLSPTPFWQTNANSFAASGYVLYSIDMVAGRSYNFTTCSDDGVGGSGTGDMDFTLYSDAAMTAQVWYIDGPPSCGYDATTISSAYEDYSPASSGTYYLRVDEYDNYAASFTLAYQGNFKSITPTTICQTDAGSFGAGAGGVYYLMNLSSAERYNFSLCANDACGGYCSGDGDLTIYDEFGTLLWYIDGEFSCDYDATTLGTFYENWSPSNNGSYFLFVDESSFYPATFTIAYWMVAWGTPEMMIPFTGNNSFTVCTGNLYDHGGSAGDYSNYANGFTVLYPGIGGNMIQISGTTAGESCCDYAVVYNGVGTEGTVLGTYYMGTAIPTLTSTDVSGTLTVMFYSDVSITGAGIDISIACVAPPSCIAPSSPTTTNITPIGADLGWTDPYIIDSFFDIFVQIDGLPAPDGSTTPTVNNWNSTSYTYSAGSQVTAYDWYVRTDCAAGAGTGQSDWAGPYNFTTTLTSDDCANAIAISEVVDMAFSTVGSTQSSINPGCGGSDPYDIWYVYTASYSGTAIFDLCGSGYDTRLALYDACGGNVLACNDDYCGVSSLFLYDVNASTDYYVQIGGFSNAVGTGDLSIAFENTEWTGSAKSNDWNTAGNWTAGIPGSTSNITIPAGLSNYPTLTSAGVCNTIYMGSDASLLDNGYLTISDAITGVTVERTISCDEAHSYSPSVGGATAEIFHLLGSTGLDVYLYSHTEANNATNGGYFNIIDLGTVLEPMAGYAVYPDGVNATPPQYEWTFIQVGGLNTATFGIADNMTRTGTVSFAGFNYIGNPYPSFIDWNAATGWTKTNMNATIWNERNGGWADYTAPGPGNNGGSNIIAPGQGFFVEVNSSFTLGTVTMNNNVRTHASTPYLKTVPTNYVQLRVTGFDKSDETVIRFEPNATLLFDGKYDGAKLMASDLSLPQIYSVADRNLSYNALPETDCIQLGFFAGGDGEYKISVSDISDLSNLWLEDTFTGIFTNLTTDSYTFSHNVLNEPARFILHFTPLAVPENFSDMINIYSNNHDVYVAVPANTRGTVKVYNLMGQEAASSVITGVLTRITLDKSAYYVVEVVSDESVVTKKVFVK